MRLNQIENELAPRWHFRRTASNILTALALLLPVFLFSSCADSASERAETVGGVTARQVIENPRAYVGKTVTVSGDVEEIHGPRAFTMDSGLTIGELLVVGREPFPNVPNRGNTAYVISDTATVTGVVQMMVTSDIEREVGWDLEPHIEAEFNAKPVLIARSIAFRPNPSRAATNHNVNQSAVNTNANTTTNTMTNAGTARAGDGITDIEVFASTSDKLSLVKREGRFTNARVVRIVGPRTFTIASGNTEMYVMLDDESARGVGTQGKIDPGKTLSIIGEFVRLQTAEIDDINNNRFRALTERERSFLKNTPVFLKASQISDLK